MLCPTRTWLNKAVVLKTTPISTCSQSQKVQWRDGNNKGTGTLQVWSKEELKTRALIPPKPQWISVTGREWLDHTCSGWGVLPWAAADTTLHSHSLLLTRCFHHTAALLIDPVVTLLFATLGQDYRHLLTERENHHQQISTLWRPGSAQRELQANSQPEAMHIRDSWTKEKQGNISCTCHT